MLYHYCLPRLPRCLLCFNSCNPCVLPYFSAILYFPELSLSLFLSLYTPSSNITTIYDPLMASLRLRRLFFLVCLPCTTLDRLLENSSRHSRKLSSRNERKPLAARSSCTTPNGNNKWKQNNVGRGGLQVSTRGTGLPLVTQLWYIAVDVQ